MRRWVLLAALCVAGAAGCKPDLGAPPSLVTGPRILAVRGTPAEATPGAMVTYDILAVDVTGTVAAPDVGWAQCLLPDPPAFGNDVSDACLAIPDDAGPAAHIQRGSGGERLLDIRASDAAGHEGAAAQPPRRSGPHGWVLPAGARRGGRSTGLLAFALERVTCRLANAPPDVATQYATEYTPNQNPSLAGLVVASGGAVTPMYAAGQAAPPAPATIGAGQKAILQADFSGDSAETFLVWDVVQLKLLQQRESLRVVVVRDGGGFVHDVSGRASDDPETYTQNSGRRQPSRARCICWAVLRDNRGGIDFASAEIDVTP